MMSSDQKSEKGECAAAARRSQRSWAPRAYAGLGACTRLAIAGLTPETERTEVPPALCEEFRDEGRTQGVKGRSFHLWLRQGWCLSLSLAAARTPPTATPHSFTPP